MTAPESPSNSPSIPPNESLPPVEPPSPGFLVQLFVIPAVIVAIIVVVWTMFTWLAQKGNDVDSYLVALRRDTPARWQAAVSLADLVRSSGDEGIRRDAQVAQQLKDILHQELTNGRTDEPALQLRAYLCNALGEFRVPDVLPALLEASTKEKGEAEKSVRFAALKSIAVYIDANPAERAASADKIQAVIDQAAQDDKPLLRSTAAFAYSALDTEAARAGLGRLLQDSTPDVRYNAALMLARRGDARAVDVLTEMLAADAPVSAETDEDKQDIPQKRMAVQINALRTIEMLAKPDGKLPLDTLQKAVESLATGDAPAPVKAQAIETLAKLKR
ncbi:MAG: HEAT repeat domain-containing protein [Planctomycetaceae bacterium]|nr:HEAT repeat domain-containing protein [Planctomycetaceae bacterium]